VSLRGHQALPPNWINLQDHHLEQEQAPITPKLKLKELLIEINQEYLRLREQEEVVVVQV